MNHLFTSILMDVCAGNDERSVLSFSKAEDRDVGDDTNQAQMLGCSIWIS